MRFSVVRTGSARSLSSPSVEKSASGSTTALFISMLRFALPQKTAVPEVRTTSFARADRKPTRIPRVRYTHVACSGWQIVVGALLDSRMPFLSRIANCEAGTGQLK